MKRTKSKDLEDELYKEEPDDLLELKSGAKDGFLNGIDFIGGLMGYASNGEYKSIPQDQRKKIEEKLSEKDASSDSVDYKIGKVFGFAGGFLANMITGYLPQIATAAYDVYINIKKDKK